MNARVRVPMMAMTVVELARHGRLGGGELSAIRRLMKEYRIVETALFV